MTYRLVDQKVNPAMFLLTAHVRSLMASSREKISSATSFTPIMGQIQILLYTWGKKRFDGGGGSGGRR